MTYPEVLDYLYSQLPMFHRTGPAAYKPSLDNTIALSNLLGNPENSFQSIHIAGTNGKGSSSHMLAAIFQAAGYKTGLYTSPHLKDFRERIRINGQMIPRKKVSSFVNKWKNDFEKIKPSFFEMTVGLCFDYFREEKVEIAVIETGLGGRLDSTNIITPLLSLITNISMDHTSLLGNTPEAIAREKAGIIKPSVPAIISESNVLVDEVFKETARKIGSSIYFADKIFHCENVERKGLHLNLDVYCGGLALYKDLELDLPGLYQKKNLPGVIQAINILKGDGFTIKENHIRRGLKNVKMLTGLRGRWEILSEKPKIIADTGHNEAGIREVLENIKAEKFKTLHFVIGMVADKDVQSVLRLLPSDATYYFCKPDLPRALEPTRLQAFAKDHGLKGDNYESVELALKAAKAKAKAADLIFIGGSTFVVAEAL